MQCTIELTHLYKKTKSPTATSTVKSAHATTVPLLVPLLLLDDVVGAGVALGDGVAPGEGVAVDEDDDGEEAGVGVGDGVVVVESSSVVEASLFSSVQKKTKSRRQSGE